MDLIRAALGTAVAVVLVAACSSAPETPANGIIDLVLDLQTGDLDGVSDRICDAHRDEFADQSSTLRSSVEALDGWVGLSDRGWPEKELEEGTAVVYGAAGKAGPPVKPWFSPPQRIWAVTMEHDDGRWRLCDVEPTNETLPGSDTRMPCAPGKSSDPDDPDGCRAL